MWLICQSTYRKGATKLLIRGIQGAEWVFCPMVNSIKSDKVNVEGCQRCSHFIRFEQTRIPQAHFRTPSLMPKRASRLRFVRPPLRPNTRKATSPRSFSSSVSLVKEKQPMVDVFEDGDYVVILAELPGMDEENVKVEASENVVRITAENSAKSYSEIVKIPVGTLSRAVKFTYRNNVLQARLEKTIHD